MKHLAILWLCLCLSSSPLQAQCLSNELTIQTREGRFTLSIEIADSWFSRMRGLMGRTLLPDHSGMLFVYEDEASRTFWMKNTHLSLDLIFLDANGRITHIVRNAMPNYTAPIASNGPAKAVLEFEAGKAWGQNLLIGDQMLHSVFGNCHATD